MEFMNLIKHQIWILDEKSPEEVESSFQENWEIGVLRCTRCQFLFKSFSISDAYLRQWTGSALVQVMDYHLGAVSIRKTVLPGMAIPMLKIRRPNGRLIFNMENAIRR